MKKSFKLSDAAFQMDGKMPLAQAIPLGLSMFWRCLLETLHRF